MSSLPVRKMRPAQVAQTAGGAAGECALASGVGAAVDLDDDLALAS